MTVRFAGVVAGAAVGLAACSAGSGGLATYSPTGRDDPGSTRDPPPGTRDNPGGSCIVCDVSYKCSGPEFTLSGAGGIELSTGGGTCTQALIELVCSGALFDASGCTGGGGGPFTCGSTTCSPGSSTSVTVVNPALPAATASPPSTGSMGSEPDAG